jgi:hypothetical protein
VTVLVVRALELRREPGRLSVWHLRDRPGLGDDDPRLLALDLADTQAGVLRFLQDLGAVSEGSERFYIHDAGAQWVSLFQWERKEG